MAVVSTPQPMHSQPDFPTDLQGLEQDYELIRELGQGGMAAVYLARRRDTGRLVAIKAIRARYLDDPDALQRFAREARTVADLDHPNIVRTEAIEQIGDRAVAIIMEYIAGGTVRDRLREYGPFSAEDAENVLRDLANALGYAHRRGIVHRDVKPENVFIDPTLSRAILSDFGIARRIEGDVPITLLGAALGTPQYMSPEQIDGRPVDGRSDIYSLGVLGWELLTGRRPWAGENLYGVIYKQKHEELPRITSLRPRVPANVLFAIERALVKDVTMRWQSIDEFLQQLTYSPPPVLAQAYPAAAVRAENEPTLKFRRDDISTAPVPASAVTPGPVEEPNEPVVAVHEPPSPRPEVPRQEPERVRRARIQAGRRAAPWWLGRRNPVALTLGLVLPLLIAGASAYVLFGGGRRGGDADRSESVLTSSAGNVALDSSRADTSVIARPAPSTKADTTPAPVGRAKDSVTTAPPPVRPKEAPAVAPKAPPPVPRTTTSAPGAATRPVPSPRCRVATMADQRACLLAYIAVNDASLQRVYDSLIVELRRAAGVRRGAPDPAAVTRLRVEQRAWIAARDRECTRRPSAFAPRYWAEPLSECFTEMSSARAAELRETLRRMPSRVR